jgi:hypothetical protein
VTRAQYWTINAVSLALAVLIGFEIRSVHQFDDVTSLLQHAQTPLLAAEQRAPQIQRLIQRTAVGATRDPALKDLLSKYGILVTLTPGSTPEAQTSAAPAGTP